VCCKHSLIYGKVKFVKRYGSTVVFLALTEVLITLHRRIPSRADLGNDSSVSQQS